jgi:galactokinase
VDATFSLHDFPQERAREYKNILTDVQYELFVSNLSDREVLKEALKMFRNDRIDHVRLGELLTIHQESLRDAKKVSTPKINAMIDGALKAGALGAKINGSGGGGCMFAYAPDQPEAVAEAIERAGGTPYLIRIDEGTTAELVS